MSDNAYLPKLSEIVSIKEEVGGGRAISELLRLDLESPTAKSGDETIALSSIRGITALSEIITQAQGQNFAAVTIANLNAGDLVSMFVSGTPNRTVTFDNVNYYITELRGPAQ